MTFSQSVASSKGRDTIISEYLNETGLVNVLKVFMNQLGHEAELPYNPYPGLVRQARRLAER